MRALLFVALCLILAAACDAAYAPSQTLKIQKKGDEDAQSVAFRYYVKPDKRKGFLDAWSKHEEATWKEKNVMIFDLKFPMSNNVEYIGYGEWKSMKDYAEHYDADHTKSFLGELEKQDVPYTLEILKKPDVGELRREPKRGDEKNQAHVLIRYHVHPSARKDFLGAWDKAEKGTEGEEGAHIYSLRRVVSTNTEYYAYGTWASMKEYQAHFESDHLKQLRDSLDKHNIIWHLSPLARVGGEKPKK